MPIPSVIWLQTLDDCLVTTLEALDNIPPLRGEVGHASVTRPGYFRSLFEEDWELGAAKGSGDVKQGELPREIVKRGSEVMNYLSHKNRPDDRELNYLGANAQTLSKSLRISLGEDNSTGVCLKEATGVQMQTLDLFFGTADLRLWAIEWMHELCSRTAAVTATRSGRSRSEYVKGWRDLKCLENESRDFHDRPCALRRWWWGRVDF